MNFKKAWAVLNPFKNDVTSIDYYLRFLDYFLSGLSLFIFLGNKDKALNFHRNINPVHKLRLRRIENLIHAMFVFGKYNFPHFGN